jgi:hypothetical protein
VVGGSFVVVLEVMLVDDIANPLTDAVRPVVLTDLATCR